MKFIDLRSDTVTQPSSAMREVLASASVGDDRFGDDPSVNALQKKVAMSLGHETALFFRVLRKPTSVQSWRTVIAVKNSL